MARGWMAALDMSGLEHRLNDGDGDFTKKGAINKLPLLVPL